MVRCVLDWLTSLDQYTSTTTWKSLWRIYACLLVASLVALSVDQKDKYTSDGKTKGWRSYESRALGFADGQCEHHAEWRHAIVHPVNAKTLFDAIFGSEPALLNLDTPWNTKYERMQQTSCAWVPHIHYCPTRIRLGSLGTSNHECEPCWGFLAKPAIVCIYRVQPFLQMGTSGEILL